jgi:hypothetical protein
MSFRRSIHWLPAIALSAVCLSAVVAQDTRKTKEPPLPPLPEEALPEGPAPAPMPSDVKGKPEDVASLSNRLLAVGEALSASNAELASLREQHSQLKLQMEALGVAAIKGDERSLQRRLLKAVADLSASETARTEITEKANRLAEAAAAFMASPGDPVVKASLNEAMKAVAVAKPRQSEPVPLESARVVSYKSELGLAVVNAGSASGVRMGAPMNIFRGDRSIGRGLVIDVRERLSGILLTGSAPAAVKAGDSVKPELIQPLQPSSKK